MKLSFLRLGLGLSCAAVLAAVPARADTNWTGLADTDWQSAGNWDNGVPSAATHTVVDTNSGNMPVITGGAADAASLTVGSTNGSNAQLTVTSAAALTTADYVNIGLDAGSAGSISLYDASTWDLSQQFLSIGFDGAGTFNLYGGSQAGNISGVAVGEAAGSGTLVIDGAGSVMTVTEALYAGGADGTTNITVSNGGKLENSLTEDWYAMLGSGGNSTVAVTVTGNGSQWIVHSNIYVAYSGNATLDILDGGVVESLFGQVGMGGVGNATVSGEGSTWTITQGLSVGDGSDATLTISAGGVVTAAGATIAGAANTTAQILVTGEGSSLTLADNLDIGYGGNGALNVEDGATVGAASVNIGAATDAFGDLTVTGANSTLTASSNFNVGYFSPGNATVADGGSIVAQGCVTIGYGFEATLSVTGAGSAFTVSSGNLNVAWGGNASLYVGSGGAVAVSTGALVMSDDGIFANVTVAAGGTLQVGGEDGVRAWNDNNNYEFLLDGGTLKVAGADLTTNIFVLLADDTNSIIDTNGFNATFNGEIGGPGGLVKNGAGVLSLAADNCYNGTTTVNAGTLNLPEPYSKVFGDVVVNAAGTLSGNGDIMGDVTLTGTLSPGGTLSNNGTTFSSSPGIISSTNMTWNDGSTFRFEINDAVEDCGCEPNWDTAYIYGDLILPADLLLNPMVIAMATLDPADNTPGEMDNFDPSQSYSWMFAAVFNDVDGFDADKFDFDLSGFENAYAGLFSVTTDSNMLWINYSPVPEPSTYAALAGLAALVSAAVLRRRRR